MKRVAGAIKSKSIGSRLRRKLIPPWRTRVLLLNHTGHLANWGCIATSKGLLDLIGQQHPGAAISRRDIRFAKDYDEYRLPARTDQWDAYLADPATPMDFGGFDRADLVVLNGEGSIHEWSDMRARPEPYLRLLEAYAARWVFNKPVMAVNQTVDYWTDEFARWAKKTYESCDYVSVREPRSLKRLRSLGLANVQLVPDAAFLTGSTPEDEAWSFLRQRNIPEGYVALFLGESVARASVDRLVGLVLATQEKLGRQVVLFAAPQPDVKVARQLKSRLGLTVVGLEASPEMLVGMLKMASITLSGRFHCCIFAALASSPLVPFRSNTDKIEGAMELLDYDVPVTAFEESTTERIIEIVRSVWRDRANLKSHLQSRVPEVVRMTREGYPNILRSDAGG